ncbi:MAG: hypothetical protein PHX87_06405 [Candidatus Peribacteraceae bacterium]|nr:hypothetical protein [Candidatus Peribacteraceae bacterium]MDD5743021.1 hypothetical protein [Candidatus Peribacteraceae bacterium]
MSEADAAWTLREKFQALEAFLVAAGAPEERVRQNVDSFRQRCGVLSSLICQPERETDGQYGARARLLARFVFDGISDESGLVTIGQFTVLDFMRGDRENLLQLFANLDPTDPKTDAFAQQFGLVQEPAEE